MTVIGARTSQGKTSLALQFVMDFLEQGKSVLLLSLEMEKEEIVERMFANKYKINNEDLGRGGFRNYPEQWKDFHKFSDNLQIIISRNFGREWNDIAKFLDTLEVMPDVILLDHIQAAPGASKGKEWIDDYVLHFFNMCKIKNFAGIIVSQLNRQATEANKTPQLHNLKGSGNIEEIADIVILLEWDGKDKLDQSKFNDFTIYIAKNRSGPTGYMKIKYFPQYYLFEEDPETLAKKYLPKEEEAEWEE